MKCVEVPHVVGVFRLPRARSLVSFCARDRTLLDPSAAIERRPGNDRPAAPNSTRRAGRTHRLGGVEELPSPFFFPQRPQTTDGAVSPWELRRPSPGGCWATRFAGAGAAGRPTP